MQAMLKFGCLLSAIAVPLLTVAAEAPMTSPDEATKSVFVNDPTFGKDPFFPRSTRRPLPKPVAVPSANPVSVPPEFPDAIQLKGISLASGKKLAMLNYATFAEGEEADLRLDGQVVRVQCLEIKERSAIIEVKGVRRELQLRQGL